eukprot:11785495-Alexandrium_andersonii.AAC.1
MASIENFIFKKAAKDVLKWHSMDAGTKEQFWSARGAEFKNLAQTKAMTVLTPEQSSKFEAEHPECALKSDWVEKWKPLGEGGYKA